MRIAIIGSGAWGTGLAIHASQSHAVWLVARDPLQAARMQQSRRNAQYLPECALPPQVQVIAQTQWVELVPMPDLLVIATPLSGLASTLEHLVKAKVSAPVIWLCKGFDAQGRMPHQIAHALAPDFLCGVLTGPSFAQEVAQGQPTALVAASTHDFVRLACQSAFHFGSIRVYANADIVGAEVGAAVKNVLAIAVGLCDGLGLGLNARAALMTRGLAEMTRFALALGGRLPTLMGLSGLGDLVLTSTGDLSRNRRVGLLLAQGQSCEQATQSLGHVAEGVRCAAFVVQRARALGIEMPICQGVVALLSGVTTPAAAVAQLMGRESKPEQH